MAAQRWPADGSREGRGCCFSVVLGMNRASLHSTQRPSAPRGGRGASSGVCGGATIASRGRAAPRESRRRCSRTGPNRRGTRRTRARGSSMTSWTAARALLGPELCESPQRGSDFAECGQILQSCAAGFAAPSRGFFRCILRNRRYILRRRLNYSARIFSNPTRAGGSYIGALHRRRRRQSPTGGRSDGSSRA